jgi:hypothetical protein
VQAVAATPLTSSNPLQSAKGQSAEGYAGGACVSSIRAVGHSIGRPETEVTHVADDGATNA